jgi:hypothetical protein
MHSLASLQREEGSLGVTLGVITMRLYNLKYTATGPFDVQASREAKENWNLLPSA